MPRRARTTSPFDITRGGERLFTQAAPAQRCPSRPHSRFPSVPTYATESFMHRATCLLIAFFVSTALAGLATSASAQTCTLRTKGALVFDGVDDYLRVPHHGAMDNMANFTFEAWLRATPTGSGLRAFIEHGGGNPYLLSVTTTGLALFIDGNLAIQGGPNLLDNYWHHFALTGAANVLHCYIDGGL